MEKLFSPILIEKPYRPVIYGYYDRADMEKTTGWPQGWHRHNVYEMMYVAKGKTHVLVKEGAQGPEKKVPIYQHQFMFLNANVWHSLGCDKNYFSMVNIEFGLEPCREEDFSIKSMYEKNLCVKKLIESPNPYLVLADPDKAVLSLLKQTVALADSRHQRSRELTASLTSMLVLMIARQYEKEMLNQTPQVRQPILKQAIDQMYEDDESLTIKSIAKNQQVHPTYLAFLFKEYLGTTPTGFFRQVKCKKAKKLLEEKNDSLFQIAAAVGFNSQQYFIESFKKEYGITPGAYRKKWRAKEMEKQGEGP